MNNFSSDSLRPHPISGLLGALAGSIPGIILWCLLFKLGVFASVSSIVIIAGVIIGFGKSNKNMGTLGTIICLVISVVMIYVAAHLSWSFRFYFDYKRIYSLTFCITHLKTIFLVLGGKVKFCISIALGYIFSIGGLVVLAKKNK